MPAKVKDLTEEVCAFANAAGGTLLIGINDNNQIIGCSIDNAKRSAIQNSLSEITPHLAFRIGPNTQKLTTAEQMRDFFQQASKIYFDEMPCLEFVTSDMLDKEFLPIFKANAKITDGVPDEQLFTNLKLYTNGNTFKNGAALFFGKQPETSLEKAIVRCVAYQGKDKRFIVDDKIFGGNLYNQYRQAMQWLRGKLNVRYDIEGQGGDPRREIWEIPETVFKESIINALSHRDYYDKGSVTNIEVFNNRVEISNPGGLVSAIPEAEFGKRSHSRNPLIFGLFARMHLVEQVGSGIGRIRELMKEAALPEPVFQKEGIFTVTLSRADIFPGQPPQKSSVKSSVKIIAFISQNRRITIPELAEKLGVTTRAIEKQIANLKKEGKLERQGPDKGGFWKVIDQEPS